MPTGGVRRAISLFFLLSITLASAEPVNVTINDQAAPGINNSVLPTYQRKWIPLGDFDNSLRNDPLETVGGSWTTAMYGEGNNPDGPPSMTLSFNGTAIYVYTVLPDQNAKSPTNVSIILDGDTVGSFEALPPSQNARAPDVTYQYNVTVYSNASLSYAIHSLTVVLLNTTLDPSLNYEAPNMSIFAFDYALYTVDVPIADVQHKGTSVGTIVGGTLGGIVGILGIFALMYDCGRRPAQADGLGVSEPKTFLHPTRTVPSLLRGESRLDIWDVSEVGTHANQPSSHPIASAHPPTAHSPSGTGDDAPVSGTLHQEEADGTVRTAQEMANLRLEFEMLREQRRLDREEDVEDSPPPAYSQSFA